MAASPTGSSSSAPAAAAAAAMAAAAEATDGPTLSVVSKRLRALRKKHNRILQMEESLAGGRKLNKEQEEVLRSKPVVVALIDELERMRAPLAAALAEELSSRPAPSPSPSSSSAAGPPLASSSASASAAGGADSSELSSRPAPSPSPSSSSAAGPPLASSSASASAAGGADSSVVEDLLALIYFGTLFDLKPQTEFVATMVARAQERDCCITYDYVTEDAADLLHQSDLDKVSALAALAASRPAAAVGVSHRDALQSCAQHARLWLRRADEPIHPESSITYAAVRAKLDKIMASDYYTAQPEMPEMGAAVDLSAAVQESMVVSPEAPAVEESQAEGHKEEKEASEATEIYNDNQPNVADAQNVEDEAPVNPSEEFSAAEVEQKFEADVEEQERNADQQFTSRRPYQNQRGGGGRGGGRRGYQNGGRGGRGGRGMGGGGYQNGRGGGGGGYQNGRGGGGGGGGGYYYNEPGYYQQRGYSNRGRGGRSSGGNSYYNNQGGGSQGGGHAHPGRVELGANA
uniref:Uncharacterized protein n=1 Tax=Oryza meridionalis TaxID=40149 RepID=A0A0E0D4R2_9ORYZ